MKNYFIVSLLIFNFNSFSQGNGDYMGIPVDAIYSLKVDALDSVTIRSAPNRSSKSICRLPSGWQLNFIKLTDKNETIAKAFGSWIQVSFEAPNGEAKMGYIFDYYTYMETNEMELEFSSVECSDECMNMFIYKGNDLYLSNYLCLDRGPVEFFQDAEGNAIQENLNQKFYIRLVTEKHEDPMANDMSGGEIMYSRGLFICDIRKAK